MGFSTLCCLSNFLKTWENQSPKKHSAQFLKTHYFSPYFSSFKNLEIDLLPNLIFDLKTFGITKAIENILALSQSNYALSLSPSEIDWIIERLQSCFPDKELIQELRNAFSFERTWITPMLTLLNGQDTTQCEKAKKTIKENLEHLENDLSLTNNPEKLKRCESLFHKTLIQRLGSTDVDYYKKDTTMTQLTTIFNFFNNKDPRIFTYSDPKTDTPPLQSLKSSNSLRNLLCSNQ